MEALISQFTLLSDQSLQDKNFDPSTIEDLMKLFEIEAYKSWAAMELEQDKQVEEAEKAVQQAEHYLDSVMEDAMDEFRRFEEDMERMAKEELDSLETTAESARLMGKVMEKAANIASKKYVEAALNSATASMKSAWKGLSSKKSPKFSKMLRQTVYCDRATLHQHEPSFHVEKWKNQCYILGIQLTELINGLESSEDENGLYDYSDLKSCP